MSKLYICGITQNKKDSIKKIIDISSPYVDGFVWTDHYSTDGTYELLESNKKEGKIYQQEYSRDHDFSANRWLRSGHIKEGDWCFILDSSDLPNEWFLKQLRENIKYWTKNNIGAVYGDRPWLIRYTDTTFVFGSVHWGLQGIQGDIVNLEKIESYKKENYIINGRDSFQSSFIHPARYWLCFGRSNHTQLLYAQFSPQIHANHEHYRINFRNYCKQILGLDLSTLDPFINYLKGNVGKYPKEVEEALEIEVNLKDLFRLFVLKQPWQELATNRFNFSYLKWKETGQIHQGKNDGYVGLFNQYRAQKGLPYE